MNSVKACRCVVAVLALAILALLALLVKLGPENTASTFLPEKTDSPPDFTPGYWGEKTSTVNWCESDYVVTYYVAEFCNTMSSMCMIGIGGYGLVMHYRTAEKRFLLSFAIVVFVGFGSMLFHGTLLRHMQLLDELPMVWCNGAFFFILLSMETESGESVAVSMRRAGWITALIVVETALIVIFDTASQGMFLLCYGSGVVFEVVLSIKLSRKYNANGQVLLFETGCGMYGAGLIMWLTDRCFCTTVRPLHLHSLWHFCATTGTTSFILFWMWLRYTHLKRAPMVRGGNVATRWIQVDGRVATDTNIVAGDSLYEV
jgi:dihydroceramidase